DQAIGDGFVKRQGNGARRSVSVAFQIVVNLAARNVQNVDGGVNDADVGLVRDVQIDVPGAQAAGAEDVLDAVAENRYGPTKDGPAFHLHEVLSLSEKLRRGRQAAAAGGPT